MFVRLPNKVVVCSAMLITSRQNVMFPVAQAICRNNDLGAVLTTPRMRVGLAVWLALLRVQLRGELTFCIARDV